MIRVMIVDDHLMVRIGLGAMIEGNNHLQLVGEFSTAEDALEMIKQLRPDIVLMDLVLPGMDGITATKMIRAKFPNTQVVVITSSGGASDVQRALANGAIGYVLKNVTASDLERNIQMAYEGRMALSPEAAEALLAYTQQGVQLGDGLTRREREVLELVALGLGNAKIGEQLHLSAFTVKAHVSHILSKLGVSTRAEAAAYAVRHKLVKL